MKDTVSRVSDLPSVCSSFFRYTHGECATMNDIAIAAYGWNRTLDRFIFVILHIHVF